MEIANKVTSQKILLEKYLTNSLKQYFLVQDSNFVIYHKNPITVNLYVFGYGKSTDGYKQLYAYNRSDTENADDMTYSYRAGFLGSSFYVSVPQFNKSLISQDEYEAKIKTIIDRYRLASKNYKLIYQS